MNLPTEPEAGIPGLHSVLPAVPPSPQGCRDLSLIRGGHPLLLDQNRGDLYSGDLERSHLFVATEGVRERTHSPLGALASWSLTEKATPRHQVWSSFTSRPSCMKSVMKSVEDL